MENLDLSEKSLAELREICELNEIKFHPQAKEKNIIGKIEAFLNDGGELKLLHEQVVEDDFEFLDEEESEKEIEESKNEEGEATKTRYYLGKDPKTGKDLYRVV